MLSLTLWSWGTRSGRTSLSMGSQFREGKLGRSSAFSPLLFSPPRPPHWSRPSSAGVTLTGGCQGDRKSPRKGRPGFPEPPLTALGRRGADLHSNAFISPSCAPGMLRTLSNMHHQYFIIGLLGSPVYAWVSLEIKLYFHL